MQLSRFGVSMEQELVDHLDALVQQRGYANRSEALRAMVRRELAQEATDGTVEPDDGREIAALISLIYPYGFTLKRCPTEPFPSMDITANLQLHLRGNVCLKLLVVQGRAGEVRGWARVLTAQKGVTSHYQEVASQEIYEVLDRAIRR
ncbi:MAG: ribbon-helix-helix protein, CopG family [Spirochaetaceae bacterium]|nr:MAG: ribbon-helix-helix protein, CopG family [Spirochaetaceae bacterium]